MQLTRPKPHLGPCTHLHQRSGCPEAHLGHRLALPRPHEASWETEAGLEKKGAEESGTSVAGVCGRSNRRHRQAGRLSLGRVSVWRKGDAGVGAGLGKGSLPTRPPWENTAITSPSSRPGARDVRCMQPVHPGPLCLVADHSFHPSTRCSQARRWPRLSGSCLPSGAPHPRRRLKCLYRSTQPPSRRSRAPRDHLSGLAVSLAQPQRSWSRGPRRRTFCMPSWHGPTYRGGGVSVLVSDTLSWLGRSGSRMTWGFSFRSAGCSGGCSCAATSGWCHTSICSLQTSRPCPCQGELSEGAWLSPPPARASKVVPLSGMPATGLPEPSRGPGGLWLIQERRVLALATPAQSANSKLLQRRQAWVKQVMFLSPLRHP